MKGGVFMRTLVISDLHLGNGGDYEAFSAPEELPLLLDREAREPTHVFINGDGVDFLMNEDELLLSRDRAARQARAIVENPTTRGVLAALGRVLVRGGAVTIRLGNHDIELALPEVQAVLRSALGQPPEVAARLAFQLGDRPEIIDVGGARIMITHGEHNDPWNKVEYDQLKEPERYRYTAGSTLVKQILNPLAREYGLRFMNFLKPDFAGGALTAIAVNPSIVKNVFSKAAFNIAWQLTKRIGMVESFSDEQTDLQLEQAIREFTEEEKDELLQLLSEDGLASFGEQEGIISELGLKLGRAGLRAYASFQRVAAEADGAAEFFQLEPTPEEWQDAQRHADKYKSAAVIYGHTHAARWRAEEGLVYANTGSWIWLMELPRSHSDDDWMSFLSELKENPRLARDKQRLAKTRKRLTAVTLDPMPGGGATMRLVEWDGDRLTTQGEARLGGGV